ncbi:nitrate- and nitrite sensing domain-containing protein [Micromonospora echinospora]|uniref:sensor histidine kinase n=1 Tax=Micromonospora echinospora TaxID=1877 RepID=UPI003A8B3A37
MPAPRTARVRRHRQSDRAHRLWSVRTQLLAPIMIATVGLLALGTVQTSTALAASFDAQRARVLAGTATATVQLVHELERELAETAALRGRGGTSGRQLVDAQRRRGDAAVQRYRTAAGAARAAAPELAPALDAADEQLARLDEARSAALGDRPADPLYLGLVDALLAVADALPAQLRDTELANAAREVASVAAQEHIAALERDLLRASFTRGALSRGDLVRAGQLRGAREQRQAEFSRIAGPGSLATYQRLLTGPDVAAAGRMRDDALGVDSDSAALRADGDAWFVAQSSVVRRYNLVGRELSEQLDARAAALATDARTSALLTGSVTLTLALLAVVAATVLAVRISRRLRDLRAAALVMARRELSDRIDAITTGVPYGADGTSALDRTARIARGRDEIAQVADAFNTVNRAALHLAGEQAELRLDVTRMVEALARRIRTLITRQLRMLDEFEREETDPDALARLFALDHLAARMRRNGENLLVLAGGEPGRSQEGAYLLTDVVTAAASEIEEYTRVEADLPQVGIVGSVVGNLVHLLAELLENATVYSPPDTSVRVDGRRTVDGLVIRIHDQGIGISDTRLAEINERLAAPATLSSAAAGSMGLHVVSHLAARHAIQVSLHATGTGTMVNVELPEPVLTLPRNTFRPAPPTVERTASPNVARTVPHSVARTVPPSVARPVPTVGAGADSWFRPGGRTPAVALSAVDSLDRPASPYHPTPPLAAPDGSGGLPRRTRGQELTAELRSSPPPTSVPRAELLDPDVVRARLSALAEGVASAMRRSQTADPTRRQQ